MLGHCCPLHLPTLSPSLTSLLCWCDVHHHLSLEKEEKKTVSPFFKILFARNLSINPGNTLADVQFNAFIFGRGEVIFQRRNYEIFNCKRKLSHTVSFVFAAIIVLKAYSHLYAWHIMKSFHFMKTCETCLKEWGVAIWSFVCWTKLQNDPLKERVLKIAGSGWTWFENNIAKNNLQNPRKQATLQEKVCSIAFIE